VNLIVFGILVSIIAGDMFVADAPVNIARLCPLPFPPLFRADITPLELTP
jgi:hypothetical protein